MSHTPKDLPQASHICDCAHVVLECSSFPALCTGLLLFQHPGESHFFANAFHETHQQSLPSSSPNCCVLCTVHFNCLSQDFLLVIVFISLRNKNFNLSLKENGNVRGQRLLVFFTTLNTVRNSVCERQAKTIKCVFLLRHDSYLLRYRVLSVLFHQF